MFTECMKDISILIDDMTELDHGHVAMSIYIISVIVIYYLVFLYILN